MKFYLIPKLRSPSPNAEAQRVDSNLTRYEASSSDAPGTRPATFFAQPTRGQCVQPSPGCARSMVRSIPREDHPPPPSPPECDSARNFRPDRVAFSRARSRRASPEMPLFLAVPLAVPGCYRNNSQLRESPRYFNILPAQIEPRSWLLSPKKFFRGFQPEARPRRSARAQPPTRRPTASSPAAAPARTCRHRHCPRTTAAPPVRRRSRGRSDS